jgi:TonB family protein
VEIRRNVAGRGVTIVAHRPIAAAMKSGFTAFLGLLLAVPTVPLAPALAQQSSQPLPAESCIVYREKDDGGYRLVNNCDYRINVSWCPERGGGPCVGWENALLDPQVELPGQYSGLDVITLFACRAPATVKFESNVAARCDQAAPPPLLLASSLKNPGAIITAADYPRGARLEGTTRFEMEVAADGRPTGCTITNSSGHAALDVATCNAFMKRARFTPAKDASGFVIAGRYRGSVTWKEP